MAGSTDKKERLVSAAAKLFWHHGFQGASIKEIALEAGVPLGNVYYYFPDKASLALAVADIFVSETGQMLDDISNSDDDPRHCLVQLFERLATSDQSRVEFGCPIALATRDFRDAAPVAARRAGEAFSMLIMWIARQRKSIGGRPSIAYADARRAIVDWQGAIVIAHALQDSTVLGEAHRRIKRNLTAQSKTY